MNYSLAKIFHQSTKVKYQKEMEKSADLKGPPPEWTTIYFKEYPRLPKISLPKPNPIRNKISNGARKLDYSLTEALIKRRSEREFNGKPISLKDLSQLLFYSAGIFEKATTRSPHPPTRQKASGPLEDWNKTRRAYPSGGARFPLEIYLFNLQTSNDLKEGIYHYNVKQHSLEKLLEEKNLRKEIYPKAIWQEMILKVPVVLVISAIFDRTMMKYKERGYRYILFEAGHLGQNIYLVSTALSLKCCAIGGFDDDKFHELLDIDGDNEAVLYAFTLGY